MRIAGYVFLTLGIACALTVAFVIATHRVGHFDYPNLIYGLAITFALITTGWTLRAAGPVGGRERTAGGSSITDAEGTVELPVTPAVIGILSPLYRKQRRAFVIAMAVGLVLATVAAILGYALASPADRVVAASIPGLLLVVYILTIGTVFLLSLRQLRRDLHDRVYLRTSGPIRVDRTAAGYVVRLVDRAFWSSSAVVRLIRVMEWASIDYSRRTHMVFEVRDRSGRALWSREGYRSGLTTSA